MFGASVFCYITLGLRALYCISCEMCARARACDRSGGRQTLLRANSIGARAPSAASARARTVHASRNARAHQIVGACTGAGFGARAVRTKCASRTLCTGAGAAAA